MYPETQTKMPGLLCFACFDIQDYKKTTSDTKLDGTLLWFKHRGLARNPV